MMVISKPDKDHTQCGNCRPIALLNVDLKLFLYIIMTTLLPHIFWFIHTDQVGFIPHREARDNTRVIDLIHSARSVS